MYEVYHKPTGFRDDDRAFVCAHDNKEAIRVAKKHSDKAQDWDFINIRSKRIPDLDYMVLTERPEDFPEDEWEQDVKDFPRTDEPRWFFDNETYEDVLEEERRWFDGQSLYV